MTDRRNGGMCVAVAFVFSMLFALLASADNGSNPYTFSDSENNSAYNHYVLKDAPATLTFGIGTSACRIGDDNIFVIVGANGNGKKFYRYNIETGVWTAKANLPLAIAANAGLVWGGGNYLYAMRGGFDNAFWRYDLVNNKWENCMFAPIAMYGSIVWTGGDNIYALREFFGAQFYRYSISENAWYVMPSTPSTTAAPNALTWDGGNYLYLVKGSGTKSFYRFSISENTWATMANTPINISSTAWGCEYANGHVYVSSGSPDPPYQFGDNFFRYVVSSDTWEEVARVDVIEWYVVGVGDLCRAGDFLFGVGLTDNEYGEGTNYVTRYSTLADEWTSSASFPNVFANPFQVESEGTPAISQEYANLSENDGTYWQAMGVSVYAQYFRFNIQEAVETMDNITVAWDGWAYSVFGPKDTYLEVWNEELDNWELMATEPDHIYDNYSFGFTITENFDNYIDENGNIWIMYWMNWGASSLNTDYVWVNVGYTTPPTNDNLIAFGTIGAMFGVVAVYRRRDKNKGHAGLHA